MFDLRRTQGESTCDHLLCLLLPSSSRAREVHKPYDAATYFRPLYAMLARNLIKRLQQWPVTSVSYFAEQF
jgi:hypothetical protein